MANSVDGSGVCPREVEEAEDDSRAPDPQSWVRELPDNEPPVRRAEPPRCRRWARARFGRRGECHGTDVPARELPKRRRWLEVGSDGGAL